jgi:hypothetical protein
MKKKTLEDLPSNWRELMLQIGREGGIEVHVQNAVGVSRPTFFILVDEYPEFADAYEEYKRLSEQWWIDKAMEAFDGGKSKMFNQHLWSFIMKNRFHYNWKDKTEMDITSNGNEVNAAPIQIEIIKSQDK